MKKFSLCLFSLFAALPLIVCGAPAHDESDYKWVPRRNVVRYVIAVGNIYPYMMDRALKRNSAEKLSGEVAHGGWRALFPVNYPFRSVDFSSRLARLSKKEREKYLQIGFQLIEFDREGLVLNADKNSAGIRIRDVVNYGLDIAAVFVEEPGQPGSHFYTFATWSQGSAGDKGALFEPALCDQVNDAVRYIKIGSLSVKYSARQAAKYDGTIGCREWAYQRNRPASLLGEGGFPPDANGKCKYEGALEIMADGRPICAGYAPYSIADWQPYIDVTTRYGKLKPHVGNLIGWASFDDPPRPVIGQMGEHWICFHECPDGEAPGLIDNIRLWAARRGWPAPGQRKVPFFIDAKYGPTREDWDD